MNFDRNYSENGLYLSPKPTQCEISFFLSSIKVGYRTWLFHFVNKIHSIIPLELFNWSSSIHLLMNIEQFSCWVPTSKNWKENVYIAVLPLWTKISLIASLFEWRVRFFWSNCLAMVIQTRFTTHKVHTYIYINLSAHI